MKIGVLGTGMVGRAIASRLVALGHEVKMGSRTADNETAGEWVRSAGAAASQGAFADAAAFGELVFNCTSGGASLDALGAAGADNLAGKVLVDVANTLDFSQGPPPSLLATSKESLAEQIQQAFPEARVVKTRRVDHIVDLGDISTARGPELYVVLWLRLFGLFGDSQFNIKVVR